MIKTRFTLLLSFIFVLFALIGFVSLAGLHLDVYFIHSILISLLVLGLMVTTIIVLKIRKSVCLPLKALSDRFKALSIQGHENEDEVAELVDEVDVFLASLKTFLHEISKLNDEGQSNAKESVRQFKSLKDSFFNFERIFNEMLSFAKKSISYSKSTLDSIRETVKEIETLINLVNNDRDNLSNVSSYLDKIDKAAEPISDNLKNIGIDDLSSAIENVFKVSERAKILSMNASVESEQVGKEGRGFSAIATGIKHFSEQVEGTGAKLKDVKSELDQFVSSGSSSLSNFLSEIAYYKKAMTSSKDESLLGAENLQVTLAKYNEKLNNIETNLASVEEFEALLEDLSNLVKDISERFSSYLAISEKSAAISLKMGESIHKFIK